MEKIFSIVENLIPIVCVSGYFVAVVLNLTFNFAYFKMAKKNEGKRHEREKDETTGWGSFLVSFVPMINLIFLISTLIDFSEEREVSKKIKKEREEELKNPHWQAIRDYNQMYSVWFELLHYFGSLKKMVMTKEIIEGNKEHPAIRYLVLEHNDMFLESLEVHKEIEKMENEKAKVLIEKWLELFTIFADEVKLFEEKEKELENQMQNKRFEELVRNTEHKKTQMQKKTIKKVYEKASA